MVAAFLAAISAISTESIPIQGGKELLRGRTSASYEKAFDKALIHQDISLSTWNGAGYVLFGEGKEGVLIGQEGWLFTNEEFQQADGFEKNIVNSLDYIQSVQEQFSDNNVKLFIVPIPAKARVYQDKLGRYTYPSYWQGQYGRIVNHLQENGIATFNLLPVYQKSKETKQLFLKTDTHWTPMGARIAAMATAVATTEQWAYLTMEEKAYQSKSLKEIEHEGDLMRYVLTGKSASLLGLEQDHFTPMETVEVFKDDEEAAGEMDLFSDAATPSVTLVGTSYSANTLWNFEGFLKEAMQTDILNVADEGLGPFEVMDNYLKSKPYQNSPPKMVIWEMPERYFAMQSDITSAIRESQKTKNEKASVE